MTVVQMEGGEKHEKQVRMLLLLMILGLLLLVPSGCKYYHLPRRSPICRNERQLGADGRSVDLSYPHNCNSIDCKGQKGAYKLNPIDIITPQYAGVVDGPVAIDATNTAVFG